MNNINPTRASRASDASLAVLLPKPPISTYVIHIRPLPNLPDGKRLCWYSMSQDGLRSLMTPCLVTESTTDLRSPQLIPSRDDATATEIPTGRPPLFSGSRLDATILFLPSSPFDASTTLKTLTIDSMGKVRYGLDEALTPVSFRFGFDTGDTPTYLQVQRSDDHGHWTEMYSLPKWSDGWSNGWSMFIRRSEADPTSADYKPVGLVLLKRDPATETTHDNATVYGEGTVIELPYSSAPEPSRTGQ